MKFIVGLGNPGLAYGPTKHNIGFAVVKALAKESGIRINKRAHFSVFGKGKIAGEEVALVLPQTFMNLSGNAVSELHENEMKDIGDLLVVCDDINLDLGKVRLKTHGTSGGHKGMESIMHSLKTEDFARLRVGIATDVHKGDITDYVLSPFKRKEKRNVAHVIALACEAVACMLRKGTEETMTRFNKRKAGTS